MQRKALYTRRAFMDTGNTQPQMAGQGHTHIQIRSYKAWWRQVFHQQVQLWYRFLPEVHRKHYRPSGSFTTWHELLTGLPVWWEVVGWIPRWVWDGWETHTHTHIKTKITATNTVRQDMLRETHKDITCLRVRLKQANLQLLQKYTHTHIGGGKTQRGGWRD